MPTSKVTDGASLRKKRILDLLAYIKSNNPTGCSVGDCQSFNFAKFGLKFDTTSRMLQEMHVGGWVTFDQTGRIYCTRKVEKFAAWLYGEE